MGEQKQSSGESERNQRLKKRVVSLYPKKKNTPKVLSVHAKKLHWLFLHQEPKSV